MLYILNAQQNDTIIIFFDINRWKVNSNNAQKLDFLTNNKDIDSIWIYGYTDFLGSVAYNQSLSEKRSVSVRNYLLNRGIDNKIFAICKGLGVFPNYTQENHDEPTTKEGNNAHRIVRLIYSHTPKPQNFLSKENLVPNNIIVMENILFHPGSATFRSESYSALNELFEVMQLHNSLKIEIHGHIANASSTVVGHGLSRNRAKAVYGYLVEMGIDSSRLSYRDFGASRKRYPLERNKYELEMNRRVEIFILEI